MTMTNKRTMNGNVFDIRAGWFQGRGPNNIRGSMKSRRIRVLIIENDTPLAMMMVFVLTRAGCNVDAVHTAKKGLALARKQSFDLIALNIKLPDAGGLEVCSELQTRHITRKTPVIFISNSFSSEDMAEGKRLGAVDYVTKPVGMTDLIYRVVFHAKAKSPRNPADN
jgi:two-component system catabolic regulation response regulator CreB